MGAFNSEHKQSFDFVTRATHLPTNSVVKATISWTRLDNLNMRLCPISTKEPKVSADGVRKCCQHSAR